MCILAISRDSTAQAPTRSKLARLNKKHLVLRACLPYWLAELKQVTTRSGLSLFQPATKHLRACHQGRVGCHLVNKRRRAAASQCRPGRARTSAAFPSHGTPPARAAPKRHLTLDGVDESAVLMADLAAQALVVLGLQAGRVHQLVPGIRQVGVVQARALRCLPALRRGAAASQRGPRAGTGSSAIPVRVAAPTPALRPAAAAVARHRANSPCNFGAAEVRARN